MYIEFAIFALFVFAYSLIAGRAERTAVSGPIVFVAAGLLMGPLGVAWFDGDVSRTELRVLADLTLAIILFIDAANADLGILKQQFRIPSRMLLFGLPGVIFLGTITAALLFSNLSLFEAAILGTMLAATDAALGKAVITNKAVPTRIREGLNIESGLNDGLCVPILFVFIALAVGSSSGEGGGSMLALRLVLQELGIGLAVGLGLAAVGAWALKWCHEQGWVTEIWKQVTVVALAIACFAVAQSLHGSGYIAAFTWWVRDKYRALQPVMFATLMSIIAFFVVLQLFAANPFATTFGGAPADGEGLNPLLQNYWMTIHPPALYMGLTGWAVPFAFVVAALFTGRLDEGWIHGVRFHRERRLPPLDPAIVFGLQRRALLAPGRGHRGLRRRT